MPLDVKPLSPARRAAMVVAMVVLLAASLGFAELLVRRQQQRLTSSSTFRLPPGAKSLVVNSDLRHLDQLMWIAEQGGIRQGLPAPCPVGSGAEGRRYTLFSLADVSRGRTPPEEYLLWLFAALTANPGIEKLPDTIESTLGGAKALQTEIDVRLSDLLDEEARTLEPASSPSAFAIMRLAVVNDQVIAVGFSGAGRPNVADRQSFDDYCKSVHVAD